MFTPSRTAAVNYAMSVIRRSTDWQQAQTALADHPTLGPWLEQEFADDVISEVQSIIRDAEEQLGDAVPSNYS
jgi:hypothetical protein